MCNTPTFRFALGQIVPTLLVHYNPKGPSCRHVFHASKMSFQWGLLSCAVKSSVVADELCSAESAPCLHVSWMQFFFFSCNIQTCLAGLFWKGCLLETSQCWSPNGSAYRPLFWSVRLGVSTRTWPWHTRTHAHYHPGRYRSPHPLTVAFFVDSFSLVL